MTLHLHKPPTDPAEDFVLFAIWLAALIAATILFCGALGVR